MFTSIHLGPFSSECFVSPYAGRYIEFLETWQLELTLA